MKTLEKQMQLMVLTQEISVTTEDNTIDTPDLINQVEPLGNTLQNNDFL
jgi:hypothetical protein